MEVSRCFLEVLSVKSRLSVGGWWFVDHRFRRFVRGSYPPSSCSKVGSCSTGCSGSSSKLGGGLGAVMVPDLVKAPDFWINSAKASMPSGVPRMACMDRDLEALVSMFRY